jgi:hypothetical protein
MKQRVEQPDPLDIAHMRVAVGQGDYQAPEVVLMLTRLGESLCQYGGGEWRTRRCDCKFLGVSSGRRGEASGCAEVRTAIALIERLAGTDKAKDNIRLRAKVRKLRSLTREHLQRMEKEARLDG